MHAWRRPRKAPRTRIQRTARHVLPVEWAACDGEQGNDVLGMTDSQDTRAVLDLELRILDMHAV